MFGLVSFPFTHSRSAACKMKQEIASLKVVAILISFALHHYRLLLYHRSSAYGSTGSLVIIHYLAGFTVRVNINGGNLLS